MKPRGYAMHKQILVTVCILALVTACGCSKKEDGTELIDSGKEKIATGNFKEAVDDLTSALVKNPLNAKAFFHRATAYVGTGEYENAITDFTRCIRIEPNDPTTYLFRGSVYVLVGKINEAFNDFAISIKLNPTNPTIYQYRSALYRKINKLDMAIADMETVLELIPESANDHLAMAKMCEMAGDTTRALLEYQKFIECAPPYTSPKTIALAKEKIETLD
jgi:tetratricopeptide (TPR) repeat protein